MLRQEEVGSAVCVMIFKQVANSAHYCSVHPSVITVNISLLGALFYVFVYVFKEQARKKERSRKGTKLDSVFL